jgi:hypothetical protein
MLEFSRLVRQLSKKEIQDLISERDALNDCWEPHAPPTALQYGKTIYLQQINEATFEISNIQIVNCPKTLKILESMLGNKILARCYWHKLMPGDKIDRHDDSALSFVADGILAHRYQIYLDSDPNFILELDKKIVSTKEWEYGIVDFALEKSHFYHNNSNKPWTFLVFDVLNNLTPNR